MVAIAEERILTLLDDETFIPFQAKVTSFEKKGQEGDGLFAGFGQIDGVDVAVYSQDVSYRGGSVGVVHARKMAALIRRARVGSLPLIGLVDSGGARLQDGIAALEGYGLVFHELIQASGSIPLISVMLGVCAGGAVYGPALTDVVIMNEEKAQMFITGPKVLKQATGEEVDVSEYGSPLVQARLSGNVDILEKNEERCLQTARDFISFLKMKTTTNQRTKNELSFTFPSDTKNTYDMKLLIDQFVDEGTRRDMKDMYAPNMLTCFAQLDGQPIGVVANQPKVKAGVLDIRASEKAARFIQLCNAWGIPILSFMDAVGFYPNSQEEKEGLIRKGARILYAFGRATVPKITVIVRHGYGGAFVAMNCKSLGADAVYAFEQADIAVMGRKGAREILNPATFQIFCASDGLSEGLASGYIDDVLTLADAPYVVANTLKQLSRRQLVSDRKGNPPV
ncbi:methylmalonyl-CoA carboxyltransferase [Bacillaceae bacterium SIJ1]|uniref:acyl-CoA carboxylase subunit beta n=1 Tax=Litoribacterium kuwaitense TaxID=1398745 RepID=UPI0013EB934D|nr:carboxyl transferase domain-containing protein [Litoribacterium kuwaitense]NGP43630.1 methylmalonyl-CoA carboxyltransferase [Litoribacterium kuwaitense]